MGKFSDYFSRRSGGEDDEKQRSDGGYEFYEDTHDASGEYTARLRNFQRENGDGGDRRSFGGRDDRAERAPQQEQKPHTFQNFMVYEPSTADDVQTLIDFLKTRESAIINLDNVDPDVSQRVLDFVSGAIYALNGSVHRVAGNIFLLSPEGVGITNSSGIKK